MRASAIALLVLFSATTAHAAVPVARPAPAKPAAPSDLDKLFQSLAHTNSAEEAKPIEDQIMAHFVASGSPSVDLLMTRAAAALAGQDPNDARRILNDVVIVAPNYAEGWHQRGKMQAEAGDSAGAIVSLNKTVTLNPREFEAYAELGTVLLDSGDKKDALGVFRKALALDPHLEGLDKQVDRLSRDVEGEKI